MVSIKLTEENLKLKCTVDTFEIYSLAHQYFYVLAIDTCLIFIFVTESTFVHSGVVSIWVYDLERFINSYISIQHTTCSQYSIVRYLLISNMSNINVEK